MTLHRARVVAPFALAALSVVAALSLDRVLASNRFILPVLGAALLPHALGALVRWRSWAIGWWLGLAIVGLAAYVVLALEPSTTTFGLPGVDTWHAIERQLSNGWDLLRTEPAPARATDGAILLAVVAVWCMAALADWLAFARQTALAAISPALVFFVWTSTLGTDRTQLALTVGFCVAAGCFVLAQNLAVVDRRRTWLVSQHPTRARWFAPAAILGGGAIVVALALAPIVPGAGSDPVLDVADAGRDGAGGHSYRPEFPPFVDIGKKLTEVDDVELFTVRSDVVDYWHVAALDTYSGDGGGTWTLSAEGDDAVSVGLPDTKPAGSVEQHFEIGPLGERWLPAAYRPVAITLPNTLMVRSSGTIVTDADEVANLSYTVASALPPLAGDQLSPAQIAATTKRPGADVMTYTELPKTPDIEEIGRRASQIVANAGATTPYAQAEALRDYFRDPANGFEYHTDVGELDDGPAILQFLDDRRGYCVQFASAYAVMARSLGIPARVAVGFTPGTQATDGTYHVTSHDAHAWPEIYLSGLGWTHLFDPTPAQSGAAPGGSALPKDTITVGPTATTVPVTPTTPATPGSGSPQQPGGSVAPTPTPATPTLAPASTGSPSGTGAWLPVLLALAFLVVAVGGYTVIVLGAKRRRRARRHGAADPAVAVTGAWAEALDRLHEAEFVPQAAQTPFDIATAVQHRDDGSARPMRELARAYSAARYGEGAVDAHEARGAWDSLDELEHALDHGVSWTRRWRRRLDASTLVRR